MFDTGSMNILHIVFYVIVSIAIVLGLYGSFDNPLRRKIGWSRHWEWNMRISDIAMFLAIIALLLRVYVFPSSF